MPSREINVFMDMNTQREFYAILQMWRKIHISEI